MLKKLLLIGLFISSTILLTPNAMADVSLLNVSYDVTREFYKDFNAAFIKFWKQKTGETLINLNHQPITRRFQQARALGC